MEKQKQVQDFLNTFTNKGSVLSYKKALLNYLNFFDIEPSEYLTRDKKQLQTDITEYRNHLVTNGYAPKTVHNYITPVKMFLEHHEIDIPVKFWRNLKGRDKTSKRVERKSKKHILTKEEMRKLLSHASIKYRAIILTACTSGLRREEIINITLDDIDLRYDCPRIRIRPEVAKNGQEGFTYCSPEAKESIQEYLKIREQEKLLDAKMRKARYNDTSERKELFLCSYDRLGRSFTKLVDTSGLTEMNENLLSNRRTITFHTLRNYFITNFSKSNPDYAKVFANQRTDLERTYWEISKEEADEIYAKGVSHLFVFKEDVTSKKVKELEEKQDAKDKQLEELEQKYKELERKYAEQLHKNMDEKVNDLSKLINKLVAQK